MIPPMGEEFVSRARGFHNWQGGYLGKRFHTYPWSRLCLVIGARENGNPSPAGEILEVVLELGMEDILMKVESPNKSVSLYISLRVRGAHFSS